MEAVHVRFGALIEWLLAAVCIAAVLAIAGAVVRELRTVQAVVPVIADERRAPEPPAGVPPRSVSVPLLLLARGTAVRIGDTAGDVVGRLGVVAQVGAEEVRRVAGRERITRFYNYYGKLFTLVFEPARGSSEPRVAAIYVQ